jgi:hypothetical protein
MLIIFLLFFAHNDMSKDEQQELRDRIEEAHKKIRHWFILHRIPGPRNGLIFLNTKPKAEEIKLAPPLEPAVEDFVLKEEPLVIREELENIPPSKYKMPWTL